ncbi:hypothetical protein J6590_067523 [Homalodisca vitripennis]|nr:hypothetical protein J6590_067523 [Homalodisca vitripennis]
MALRGRYSAEQHSTWTGGYTCALLYPPHAPSFLLVIGHYIDLFTSEYLLRRLATFCLADQILEDQRT